MPFTTAISERLLFPIRIQRFIGFHFGKVQRSLVVTLDNFRMILISNFLRKIKDSKRVCNRRVI